MPDTYGNDPLHSLNILGPLRIRLQEYTLASGGPDRFNDNYYFTKVNQFDHLRKV